MRSTTTVKTMLFAAAFAVALPTATLLAQNNSGMDDTGQTVIQGQEAPATAQPGRQGQMQGQMQGRMQDDEMRMSPEQKMMMAKEAMMAQASGNQFEIEAGQYAQQTSDNDQVKQVAQTIVKDHTTALNVLREQAKQAGVDIPQKPELNKVHQQELALLKKQQGKEFNEAYIYQQDGAHLLTALYLTHFQNGSNPQLAAYANKALPKVKEHHAMLHTLANQMSGYESEGAMAAGGQMNNGMGEMQKATNNDGKPNRQEVEEYFKHANQGGQYELQTAKLVVSKSNNPQVKQIAQTVIDDHEKSQQMLTQQARAAGVDLEKDVKLDDLFQAKLDMLQKKTGSDFDRCYVFDAVAGHRMSLLADADAKRELTGSGPLQQFVKSSMQEQSKHFDAVRPVATELSGGYDFPEMQGGMSGMKGMNGDAMKSRGDNMKGAMDANPENRPGADSTGKAANGPEQDAE